MSKNYNDLAKQIIELVGGEGNVRDLRHCITRLRFTLADNTKADDDAIKKLNGVVTVVRSGGQFQVVIGEQVADVYEAILGQTALGGGGSSDEDVVDDRGPMDKFIDFISGVFQPFLMALSATGMLKGVVAILGAFGMNADNSGIYFVLNAAGDAFFQFLPVMVTITTARRLKMNEFTALAVTLPFLHTSWAGLAEHPVIYTLFAGTPFESAIQMTFGALPIILPRGGYYSAIIPIIIAVLIASKVEAFFRKRIPRMLNSFLTPFFTVMIAFPVALIIFGPIANWASALVGEFFTCLSGFSPILFGAALGAAWQLLVIFGLHWGIIPIMFLLQAEQGFDPINPATMLSTFGIFGVLMALAIKSKEDRVKQLAIPSAISSLFGISEPAVYGLMLPLRRSFIYALIANTIAGAYVGWTGTVSYRNGGLGIFAILRALNEDGSIGANFWNYCLGFVIAAVLGFALQMALPVPILDPETAEASEADAEVTVSPVEAAPESLSEEILASPLTGDLIALEDTPDEVFSSGALGKGVTVDPTEGVVKAPANGEVTSLFETGHAIGITTDLGTEMLIHIGIDTVELEGKGFEKLVQQGDKVVAGQDLIRFDRDVIEAAGKSPLVIVVITNTANYLDVILTTATSVQAGDYLLTTVK